MTFFYLKSGNLQRELTLTILTPESIHIYKRKVNNNNIQLFSFFSHTRNSDLLFICSAMRCYWIHWDRPCVVLSSAYGHHTRGSLFSSQKQNCIESMAYGCLTTYLNFYFIILNSYCCFDIAWLRYGHLIQWSKWVENIFTYVNSVFKGGFASERYVSGKLYETESFFFFFFWSNWFINLKPMHHTRHTHHICLATSNYANLAPLCYIVHPKTLLRFFIKSIFTIKEKRVYVFDVCAGKEPQVM